MAEPDLGPWKGKSPALLTYEKIAEFSNTLTAIATMVANLTKAVEGGTSKHDALEVRVRNVESTIVGMTAAQGATKETTRDHRDGFRWATGTLIALASMSVGAMGVYIALTRAIN